MPAASELRPWVCLADLRHVRHLPRVARRIRIHAASRATPGYDAEATIGPDGGIVFTSVRDGDMEIYSMNADGSDVQAADEPSGA